jgi:hypothetical protein
MYAISSPLSFLVYSVAFRFEMIRNLLASIRDIYGTKDFLSWEGV